MSAFEVPGWSLPAAPVRVETNKASKKRKRPASSSHVESAAVNVDKLMAKLSSVLQDDISGSKQSSIGASPSAKKRKDKKQQQPTHPMKTPANGPPQKKAKVSPEEPEPQEIPMENKKSKSKRAAGETSAVASTSKTAGAQASSSGLTALQKSMKDKLDGAQFRWASIIYSLQLFR